MNTQAKAYCAVSKPPRPTTAPTVIPRPQISKRTTNGCIELRDQTGKVYLWDPRVNAMVEPPAEPVLPNPHHQPLSPPSPQQHSVPQQHSIPQQHFIPQQHSIPQHQQHAQRQFQQQNYHSYQQQHIQQTQQHLQTLPSPSTTSSATYFVNGASLSPPSLSPPRTATSTPVVHIGGQPLTPPSVNGDQFPPTHMNAPARPHIDHETWWELVDPLGNVYWMHKKNGQTRWTPPVVLARDNTNNPNTPVAVSVVSSPSASPSVTPPESGSSSSPRVSFASVVGAPLLLGTDAAQQAQRCGSSVELLAPNTSFVCSVSHV